MKQTRGFHINFVRRKCPSLFRYKFKNRKLYIKFELSSLLLFDPEIDTVCEQTAVTPQRVNVLKLKNFKRYKVLSSSKRIKELGPNCGSV